MINSPIVGIVFMIGISGMIGVVAAMMPEDEILHSAEIYSANLIALNHSEDGIPLLSLADRAVITVQAVNTSDVPISSIMFKTKLENSQNGDHLFISNANIRAGLSTQIDVFAEDEEFDISLDALGGGSITEPTVIELAATKIPGVEMYETIIIDMYADGIKMDSITFDVILSSKL